MKHVISMCFLIAFGCTTSTHETVVYQPFSKAVIKLDVSKLSDDTLWVSGLLTTNIPREGFELDELTISSPGTYHTTITVDRPSAMILGLSKRFHQVFVGPNDTTTIIVDTEDLAFDGKYSVINRYYSAKEKFLNYYDTRIPIGAGLTSRATFRSYAARTDSIIRLELDFLQNYIRTDQLPGYFLDYEQAEIEYLGLGVKLVAPKVVEMFHTFNDNLPDNFFDFLRDAKIDNPKALASSRYFWFLDDYFLRDLPISEFGNLSGLKRRVFLDSVITKSSIGVLSPEVASVYKRYRDREAYADSTMTWPDKYVVLRRGDTIRDFTLTDELDSLVSLRAFRNSVFYVNFWATWCGPCIKDFPELNKLISEHKDDKRIAFLNICIQSKHDKWLSMTERHKLGGVNLFAAGNWNNFLMTNFDVRAIPHHVLIDRGNIVHRNHADGPHTIGPQIDSLLKVRR